MKRWIALLTAALLLGNICAMAQEPYEEPAPDDLFLLGGTSETGHVEIIDTSSPEGDGPTLFTLMQADGDSGTDSVLPAAYDSREAGYVPPVREQGGYNTCWAFAAIGASEVSGLREGLLSDPETVDLSERHLIYFFSHKADDPLGNSSGDYNTNPS